VNGTLHEIGPREGLDRFFAVHPGKRGVERYWLAYTPFWAGATGIVMLGGWAEQWNDVQCMAYGLLLFAGAWWGPLRIRADDEEDLVFWETAAFKSAASVTLLAFGLNYTQTPYFFDVLHMHYGWQTTWNIDRNPVFLYLMSVAYFGTYFSLCTMSFRWLRSLGMRAAAWILAPLAMAFLETVLNANPFMSSLFCYDDLPLMLWFGTLSYGVAFIFVLPVWVSLDETRDRTLPLVWVVAATLGAMYADLITLDLLRYHVAPLVTTVVTDAPGLRDFGSGCLLPPS
jgi:cycloeucalenol cycloisomerase